MERTHGRFAGLLDYVRRNLRERHCVATMAEYACMSSRNFSRAFLAETGMSPAKAVERLRAETARGALVGNNRAVKEVARSCGFGSAERLRRSFRRVFGVNPSTLRCNLP
jgi:transcriptional regulator GlxA family with amidase domain